MGSAGADAGDMGSVALRPVKFAMAVSVTVSGAIRKAPAGAGTFTDALSCPSGIKTFAGGSTTAGSLLVKLTNTPPAAAGARRVTVAVIVSPGIAFDGVTVSEPTDIDGIGVSTAPTAVFGSGAPFKACCI